MADQISIKDSDSRLKLNWFLALVLTNAKNQFNLRQDVLIAAQLKLCSYQYILSLGWTWTLHLLTISVSRTREQTPELY